MTAKSPTPTPTPTPTSIDLMAMDGQTNIALRTTMRSSLSKIDKTQTDIANRAAMRAALNQQSQSKLSENSDK